MDSMYDAQVAQIGQGPSMKNIVSSPTIYCKKCGNKVFTEGVIIKKVSSLLSTTGKDEMVPIPVYICAECGTIPDDFLSKGNAKDILGGNGEQHEVIEEKSSLTI